MAPKEPMTLYYRLTVPDTDIYGGSRVVKTVSISNIESLKLFANHYMCKSDFITPTTDIINFLGNRVPKKDDVGLPSTYLMTLTIISKPYQSENSANMITATANYLDSGSTHVTITDYVNFTVTGASGKFAGYKNIKIIFDKDQIKRTLILS